MILQNDKRIKTKWIHKEGCATMAVLWYLNKKKGLQMSPELVDQYFERLKDFGAYTDKMLIDWRKAFRAFGSNVFVSYNPIDYRLAPGEFAIGEWYNPKTRFTHFTAVDGVPGNYICTYDPLGESVTVRDGYLKRLRVFREAK
ncbi:MAG: DUF261 family protein [Spirochaetales bacterium]|nr:DUF261 family protein [Spirochaetales bacterium]